MSVLTAQHFWEWFQVNSQSLLSMQNSSGEEYDYWDNQCRMHVEAFCPPGLGLEIIWCPGGQNGLAIITAFGRIEHFEKAEAFVEQAPYIKEWTILALFPPVWLDYNIAKRHNLPGFEPMNLQFCPFDTLEPAGKKALIIYTEKGDWDPDEAEAAAYDVIYNLLGERVTTLCIDWISICTYEDALEELKPTLLSISELPKWFDDLSDVTIDKNGKIVHRIA